MPLSPKLFERSAGEDGIPNRRIPAAAMSLKRALPSLLIALFLLVTQQTACIHELSRLDRRSPDTQDKQHSHTKACLECGLLAQLGTGLTSNIATPLPMGESACAASYCPRDFYPSIPRRFLSRAPPFFPESFVLK